MSNQQMYSADDVEKVVKELLDKAQQHFNKGVAGLMPRFVDLPARSLESFMQTVDKIDVGTGSAEFRAGAEKMRQQVREAAATFVTLMRSAFSGADSNKPS